jgi:uroporphyrinogen III methyltransferase/synthase
MRRQGSLEGARVLLPRSEGGRELLAEELRKAGAEVNEVAAFRTVPEPLVVGGDRDIYKMLLDHGIDVVLFTTPSSVRAVADALGTEQAADLLGSTVVACIGPVTAEAAKRLGIETHVLPREFTLPALVEAVVGYFGAEETATLSAQS